MKTFIDAAGGITVDRKDFLKKNLTKDFNEEMDHRKATRFYQNQFDMQAVVDEVIFIRKK